VLHLWARNSSLIHARSYEGGERRISKLHRRSETTYVFNIFQLGFFIDGSTIIPIYRATTHILPLEPPVKNVGSIGILLPYQEARPVDEDENDVNEGERGELWIRGDNIMKCVSLSPRYLWVG
jgi:acyl-CoA synthetase (AMP-forming)/AMP-acid ligase II